MKVPEKFRLRKHKVLGSDSSFGNNGFFIIPHYRIRDYEIRCQVSDGLGWEHVSVTIAREGEKASRCPTWEEMCFVKSTFWDKQDCVIEYHPPESEYVSNHHFCLHLWKPTTVDIPLPDSLMVGIK